VDRASWCFVRNAQLRGVFELLRATSRRNYMSKNTGDQSCITLYRLTDRHEIFSFHPKVPDTIEVPASKRFKLDVYSSIHASFITCSLSCLAVSLIACDTFIYSSALSMNDFLFGRREDKQDLLPMYYSITDGRDSLLASWYNA